MGYYTTYTLEVDCSDVEPIDQTQCRKCQAQTLDGASFCHECGAPTSETATLIIENFRNSNEDAAYALDENGDTADSAKWYDSETDVANFSKKFPTALFTLKGEGEDAGDLWTVYAKKGKSQKCKAIITYPPMDPNKFE